MAAAGACGCSRTTAKFISPGQAQPRPKPSTTPTTSAAGPAAPAGDADRADDEHRGDHARRDRRRGGRPASRRAAGPTTQIALPRVRVRPGQPGVEAAAAAEDVAPRKCPARSRRPPPSVAGGADHRPARGAASAVEPRTALRGRRCRSRARAGARGVAVPCGYGGQRRSPRAARRARPPRTPSASRRVSATAGTAAPASSVDSGMAACLMPNEMPCRPGRHVLGQRRVAGELAERVAAAPKASRTTNRRVRPGERARWPAGRRGGQHDRRAGDAGRPVPFDEPAGGHRRERADAEVDGDGQAQAGGGEAQLRAHLDGETADQEDREVRRRSWWCRRRRPRVRRDSVDDAPTVEARWIVGLDHVRDVNALDELRVSDAPTLRGWIFGHSRSEQAFRRPSNFHMV